MEVRQHRHYWPGWKNAEELGWHDADQVHTKYPTAHEHIHSERVIQRDAKPKKGKAPVLSFNEYGEPLTQEDVDANLALYKNPPEYAEGEVAVVVTLAEDVASGVYFQEGPELDALVERTKVRNLPRSAKV